MKILSIMSILLFAPTILCGAEKNNLKSELLLPLYNIKSLHNYILSMPDMSVEYLCEPLFEDAKKSPDARKYRCVLTKKGGKYRVDYYLADRVAPHSTTTYDGKGYYYYTYRDKGLQVSSKLNENIDIDFYCALGSFPSLIPSLFYKICKGDINEVKKNEYVGSTGDKPGHKIKISVSNQHFKIGKLSIPKSVSVSRFYDGSDKPHLVASEQFKIVRISDQKELLKFEDDYFRIPISQCVRIVDWDLDRLQIELK